MLLIGIDIALLVCLRRFKFVWVVYLVGFLAYWWLCAACLVFVCMFTCWGAYCCCEFVIIVDLVMGLWCFKQLLLHNWLLGWLLHVVVFVGNYGVLFVGMLVCVLLV